MCLSREYEQNGETSWLLCEPELLHTKRAPARDFVRQSKSVRLFESKAVPAFIRSLTEVALPVLHKFFIFRNWHTVI